jgi:flagellar biosynthesis chaperone FliJ
VTPYQYRLQPLLDLKLERREELERALAGRQRELAVETEALAELELAQKDRTFTLAEALRARLNTGSEAHIYTLELHTLYLRGLITDVETGKGAVAAQRTRVFEFQDRVTEARRQLMEAARDVEVLNKHRERLEQSVLRAVERKQAAEQDEMGSIIFNHGRRRENSQ